MHLFYKDMLKYDYLITVFTLTNDLQIQLATNTILASETKFKKFLSVTNDLPTQLA